MKLVELKNSVFPLAYVAIGSMFLLYLALSSSVVLNDYYQDYVAASRFAQGLSIYDSSSEILVRPGVKANNPNDHPPLLALLNYPLSFVSIDTAFLILAVVNIVALWFSVFLLARQLQLTGAKAIVLLAIAQFWPPMIISIINGQPSAVLSLLIILSFIFAQKRKNALSSILLAVATGIKPFVALFALAFFVSRQTRLLVAYLLSLMGLAVIIVCTLGYSTLIEYTQNVLGRIVSNYQAHAYNMSLRGFSYKIFGQPSRFSPWLGRPFEPNDKLAEILTLSLLALCLAYFLYRVYKEKDLKNVYSISLLCMLLLSPFCWSHYYLILLLPLGYLFTSHQRECKKYLLYLATLLISLPIWIIAWLLSASYQPESVPLSASWILHLPTLGLLFLIYLESRADIAKEN